MRVDQNEVMMLKYLQKNRHSRQEAKGVVVMILEIKEGITFI